MYVFYFKMREQLQSPDFRNVCFPCSHFPGLVQVIEERDWNIESPCSSNRSSATSTTSSVSTSCKTEHTSLNEIERNSVMESVEPSVLTVGATAQLRRKNSSVSRGKPRLKSMQIMTTPNNDSLERSETFVAQDGVLTTNFCSTELWFRRGCYGFSQQVERIEAGGLHYTSFFDRSEREEERKYRKGRAVVLLHSQPSV